ncbi:MAG: hypothetical protein IJD37_01225, partial [Clostridia bacterium]|nr:hypothetical protein [Clostridia bacterium]
MKKYISIIILTLALLTLASCGHEHTVVIDETVNPTCTTIGLTEGAHCSECGEVITVQEEIAKAEHTVVIDESIAPSCISTGLTEGSHCSVCGEVFAPQEEIPTQHVVVVDLAVTATCMETGLTEGSHCSVCNEVLVVQEETPVSDHTFVIDAAVASTCSKTGLTEGSHCSVCGEVITKQQTIGRTGHKNVVTDEAVPATCSTFGLTEGTHCEDCGYVILGQRSYKEPHKEVIIPATNPTCQSEGKTEGGYCQICNAVTKVQLPVSKTGHKYVDGKCKYCGMDISEAVVDSDSVKLDLPSDCYEANILFGNTDCIKNMKKTDSNNYSNKYYNLAWPLSNSSYYSNIYTRDTKIFGLDGFVLYATDHSASDVLEAKVICYSSTADYNAQTPIIEQNLEAKDRTYNAMYNEIIAAVDKALVAMGDYEVLACTLYEYTVTKVTEYGMDLKTTAAPQDVTKGVEIFKD